MARVKLTEYRAKALLVDDYDGVAICLESFDDDIKSLVNGMKYVVKVDQGVKKRGKQGLIKLNVTKQDAKKAVHELAAKGFNRFIAEPMVAHDDSEERYLSIERVRNGFKILYSDYGGVGVEDHSDDIRRYDSIDDVPLPDGFLSKLTNTMDREHFSFVEINPLVVRGDTGILLDAAVLVDSAGQGQSSWSKADVAEADLENLAEKTIAELNDGSPASFSFKVLNQDGSVWLLLSGGGASITIADEAANKNKAFLIGNYGEYSGGPTREETQLYTEAVLDQMLVSNAPKKALIIAGGVANFTDVKETFTGVIDALTKHISALQKHKVSVFVRRGGPNETEGLKMMRSFLKKHKIYGSVDGSNEILTSVIDEAIEYVNV